MFRHFLLWHGSLVASLYVPKGKMSGIRQITEQDAPLSRCDDCCRYEGLL